MIRTSLYWLVLIASFSLMLFSGCKDDYPADAATLEEGKLLFGKYCSSCHGLQEDGFGPPLGDITSVLPQQDLVQFVSNPSKAIDNGDERAIALQSRYKQVMPPFGWMQETQIKSILAYIHEQSQNQQITALSTHRDILKNGVTGRLVLPVLKSEIQINLEDVIQVPQIEGSSPDLGIVTLRAHPSADGSLHVSDQDGIIYCISGNQANVFLDIRNHVPGFQSGPGIATGIASFDFHPGFMQNGLFYIMYAETYQDQIADYGITDSVHSDVQWIVSEWTMEDVSKESFTGIYRELLRLHAPTFGHGAQDLQFNHALNSSDPENGLLYFSYGDGGSNNIGRPDMCHRLTSFLGTIMRIDPAGDNSKNGKYGIPASNPFIHEADPNTVQEIYAYGFRNAHRFSWDIQHQNRMIATDIGESNIEEINIIEKGGDYGWPRREGNYGINTIEDKKTVYQLSPGDLELYKRPFAQYDHEDGYAISGGFVYEGDLTALKNKYIFGDIVNGKLFYANINARLSDSSIYELTIVKNGQETTLQEMSHTKRLHLRIGYDPYAREMYVITKADGWIRKIKEAKPSTRSG
ncbi:MAG: PQQ-dependent sugar dehydrogenase [Saprospiraceae bacterium]|nr:PQQ-dependent sugar dehydrogenase [Saprospiraceae bacterium]